MKFNPRYTITLQTAKHLIDIEQHKEAIKHLPINVTLLSSLRETARLLTTHYSTKIEGNRLTLK